QVQLFPESGEAAQQRQFPERVGVHDRLQAFAQHLDLAIGAPDGDRVGRPATHHDALEDGLTAVEELLLAHGRAHASPSSCQWAIWASTAGEVISSAAGAAGTGRRGPGYRRSAAGR